jgi:hypothetical protein
LGLAATAQIFAEVITNDATASCDCHKEAGFSLRIVRYAVGFQVARYEAQSSENQVKWYRDHMPNTVHHSGHPAIRPACLCCHQRVTVHFRGRGGSMLFDICQRERQSVAGTCDPLDRSEAEIDFFHVQPGA